MSVVNKVRTFAGPLATLIVLLAIYWLPGLAVTAVLAFVPLVWSVYTEGRGRGLLSASIVIAYAAYVYPPDYWRIAQIVIASIAIVLMVSELKRRALLSETLNGNLARLRKVTEDIHDLATEWQNLSDTGRYKRVEIIEGDLGNLATLVLGWVQIGREIRETQKRVGMEEDDQS